MLNAANLKLEYKTNPLGMDEPKPRFSYELTGDSKAQSAYRIEVKDETGKIVWDTDFTAGGQSCQIEYAGAALTPFTRYSWRVRVKDEAGKTGPWSTEKAYFETGFLGTPWQGKFVAGARDSMALQPPQRLFRKFELKKKLAKARLYATALGMYEAYLNGVRVGEDCFKPGWSDYYTRVQYQAYDVTAMLKHGANNLSALLGDGWYSGRIARNWGNQDISYGPYPLFCAELRLTYTDGSVETIVTDKEFQFVGSRCSCPIKMSDIYYGEKYEAADTPDDNRNPEWQLPDGKIVDHGFCFEEENNGIDYRGKSGSGISGKVKFPNIVWQSGAPVRVTQVIPPVSIKKRKNGTYIVDFGQNLAGREKITLRNTERGAVITIRHGEMLNADGSLYTANLRGAAATTTYITGTHELEEYEPVFTFYGFRYVEISGWPGKLTKSGIEAHAIHSDLPATGDFECSSPLVNQLFSNIVWGQRSNFVDVPTDCPQRDERYGWTGDTQVFANVATYNMYSPEFYTKWLADLNSCRNEQGAYPVVAPNPYRWGFPAATGWGDAGVICPDVMFEKYGDTRLLEKYFDNIKRWLYSQIENAKGSYIVKNACYGDWLNIDAPTDESYLSTSYLAGMAKLAAKFARILKKDADAREMDELAAGVAAAFQKKFFVKNELTVKTQTAALLALHFDLVPAKAYEKTCEWLVNDIAVTHNTHLSTGFLGTPLLLKVLTKIGQTDLAYRLLLQTTYPGWLYPVTQGATTMWERWNSWNDKTGFGDVGMNSFNHYAYGAVGEWFYETICGIQPITGDPACAGFKKFRLAPQFGSALDQAAAGFRSPYGLILSVWKKDGDATLWSFAIPCNSSAEITVPSGEQTLEDAGFVKQENGSYLAGPGEYTLEF